MLMNKMKTEETVLNITNLKIGYKSKKEEDSVLLEDINLTVRQGEFICILGPNGCGKSTLLRTISGIQKPLAGNILVEGKELSLLERSDIAKIISIALTENISMGNISVYSLVSMGRYPYSHWLGILRDNDFNIIDHALEVTGMTAYKDKNYDELSDGLRQKAVIARALAQDTPVILLDEPTAFLDITSKLEVMQMLKTLANKFGKSIILSSHDLDLALQSADTIWLITNDRSIRVDVPEDLVLNGHFEKAFNRNEIKFQIEKGIFKFEHSSSATIKICGDGAETFWTERALDRIGISRDDNSDESGILSIENRDGKTIWTYTGKNKTENFYSISQLLNFLKINMVQVKYGAED